MTNRSAKNSQIIGVLRPVILLSFLGIILFIFSSFHPLYYSFFRHNMIEICDNAIDDDDDGLIDLNDPDCECPVIEPVSLIPNPSFEEQECCPQQRAELNCATGWIQASAPTTDFIHTCGWPGPNEYFPPMPFPDGIGVMGFRDGRVGRDMEEANLNWKEYAGACLLNPLEKNTSYRFEFEVGFIDFQKSPPINVTFFGTTDCKNLPFGNGDDTFGCPTNGPNWVRLGSTNMSGGSNRWVKGNITITPSDDITAIAIGPACPGVTSNVNLYYYFDNLILSDSRSFEFQITPTDHPCSEDFLLQVPDEEGREYQWYKDGIALIGEINSSLIKMHGEGVYQVRTLGITSCMVTKTYSYSKPFETHSASRTVCEDESFPFGTEDLFESGSYIQAFKNIDNCDSIVLLNLTVLGMLADTVEAKIFKGEDYKIGNHRFRDIGPHFANLTSSIGCDSLVLVNLDHYHVYFPNVFSPYGSLQNSRFNVSGNSDLVEVKSLSVFDRWGKQVYDDVDLYDNDSRGWNGRSGGQYLESGIYAYITTLLMDDGMERQFSGTVLLVN